MQQVKLFKGVESELGQLEDEINQWLSSSGARVVQINSNIAGQSILPSSQGGLATGGSSQRFAPSDVFVAVLYENG